MYLPFFAAMDHFKKEAFIIIAAYITIICIIAASAEIKFTEAVACTDQAGKGYIFYRGHVLPEGFAAKIIDEGVCCQGYLLRKMLKIQG